ncbi:hypothetical protein [Rhodococcus sp. OK302]|uniref:hypothetical protein n=1 Tax=Rhodococcus sp. OK302 TaxID=1882769 RepID=UPI000B9F79DE|nr:hypothetical protein [Rhodococcus sp. OK302]OYD70106.1 hypothetical protein BDB13_3698 [Rhodococcus sp. OK302]
MEAFLAPLLSPAGLALALLGAITWLSFSATGRNTRRSAAATSVLLSICGSIAFLGFAGIDDYNDYPGYTCSLRDGNVPDGFPSDQLPPPNPNLVSRFHPNIAWSHEYELFPAGVRCTYWTKDDPRVTVVTHSPGAYSVWIYGLLVIALAQAARVVNPDLLARRAG